MGLRESVIQSQALRTRQLVGRELARSAGAIAIMPLLWFVLASRDAVAGDANAGKGTFMSKCSSCHGLNGVATLDYAPSFVKCERLDQDDGELMMSVPTASVVESHAQRTQGRRIDRHEWARDKNSGQSRIADYGGIRSVVPCENIKHWPDGTVMPIYNAAMQYRAEGVPLVVVAGRDYGMGSSRDWAAKGTLLLGVRAVIAESFERIHRANLVDMGVLPLQFEEGVGRRSLDLNGSERIDIVDVADGIVPRGMITCRIHRVNNRVDTIRLLCRIDILSEREYFHNGGILQYVLRSAPDAA